MSLFAVVPILPTLTSLLLLLPALLLAALTAVASLRHPAVLGKVWRLVWRQKLALLLIGLGVTGAAWAARSGTRWLTQGSSSAEFAGPDWPMDRGSLTRCGWVRGDASPVRAADVWVGGRAGESFFASPAVVGNQVVCVGSHGDAGLIACWDLQTGRRQWTAAPANYRATFSSPVISGSYLLCGEGLHHARQARVVCLDLRPPAAGRVAWTFQTQGHVECTPTVAGDRVYVGAGDDGIYCLQLDPRVPDEQRVVWHAPGSRYPDTETALAVSAGRVYAGLGVGGNALCVLDAETGAERARIPLPYPVFSPPALDGGKLFVGMGRGDYVRPVDQPAGSVCCLDLATLNLEWSFATPATVLGAVAAAGDQLIVGCADGCVYVLDRQGRLLRKWDSRWPIVAAPCVTDRFIYVVNQGGLLYALDRQWLQPVWEARLGQPGRYFSSPAVAQGRVLIGTERDGFRCVGEPGGGVDDPALWPGELGGPGVAGCRDGSGVPQKAEVIWEWLRLADSDCLVSITASAAAAADAIVVSFAAGAEFGLACLETSHDEPKLRWSQRVSHALTSSPVIAGGKVVTVTGPGDGGERQISAFDLQAGTPLWRVPIDGSQAALPSATTDRVFVQEAEDTLSCRTLDGRLIWTQNVGRMAHEVDVSGDLLIAAISSPPTLLALDAPTGRRLWSCPLDQPATTAPAARGNRICFADPTGVQARSLFDGRRLWQCLGAASGPLYVDRDRFAFVDAAGEIMLGEAATGAQLAFISVHQRLVQGHESRDESSESRVQTWGHPLVAGNAVLWPGPSAILAADLQGRNVREFFPLATDAITAAPLLHAGRIYLGMAGRGLVCLGDRGGP